MDLMDYRRKIIANSPHLASASGAIATFSDGADLPLKSLIVNIEPVQSGTGDPSPTNIRPISGWSAVNVKNENTVIANISLGQTVYGGTLNPLTGVLTVDRAFYTFGGTESVNAITSVGTNVRARFNNSAMGGLSVIDGWMRFSHGKYSTEWNEDSPHGYVTPSYTYLFLPFGGTNAEAVRTYLASQAQAGTPVQICYELASPITYQLTPQQVRSLYGQNNIWADTGNVALEYWAHP